MIEVPDPVHDDASESEVAEDPEEVVEEVVEEAAEEEPAEAEAQPDKPAKQTLKDRVQCEACQKEISRYCLQYSHKCKAKKNIPEPPPAPPEAPPPRRARVVKERPAERPVKERVRFDKPHIGKRVLNTANYWREMAAQDEPESPEWNTADHMRQLHLYNQELANRRAAAPYEALFARKIRV